MTAEFDHLMKLMKRNNLAHYARMIENTKCRILVEFDISRPSSMDEEYNEWCKENCTGDYYVYNEYCVFFELEEEAVAFKLRWL